jgi:hypothetical protein
MRSYSLLCITRIDGGLENLHLLTSNCRSAQSPDQLVGLATKHRPSDHFNQTIMMFHKHHLYNKFSGTLDEKKQADHCCLPVKFT